MTEIAEKKRTPLRPYDSSLVDNFDFYNHFPPYKRDINICTTDMIKMVTGNIVKFFRCNYGNTYVMADTDEMYHLKLQEKQEQEKKDAIKKQLSQQSLFNEAFQIPTTQISSQKSKEPFSSFNSKNSTNKQVDFNLDEEDYLL